MDDCHRLQWIVGSLISPTGTAWGEQAGAKVQEEESALAEKV
jgi:hypothetical protein